MLRNVLARSCLLLLATGVTAAPASGRMLPFLGGVDVGGVDSADSVAAADLDGDGDLDLAVGRSSEDEVLWLEATPAGYVQHTVIGTLDGPNDLATADVDCDGDVDLVIALSGSDEVVWQRNDGAAASWSVGGLIGSAPGLLNVAVGDINGNGTVDVVSAATGADEIVAWTHPSCSSAVWNPTVVSSALASARTVELADTNRDGRLDVVGIADGDSLLAVWEKNAGAGFTRVDVDATLAAAYSVGLGDLDGDGDVDVAATSGNEVAWWSNPGGAGAWAKTAVTALTLAQSLYVADVDADGDLDVVATSQGGDVLGWYDNVAADGSAWSEQVLDPMPLTGRKLVAADFGGDGDVDVVATSLGAGVTLYENVSSHRSADLGLLGWTFHSLGSGGQLVDLESADMDGDGQLDLVAVWEGNVPNDCYVIWYAGFGADPTNGILRFDSTPNIVRQGGVRFFESVALGDVNADGEIDAFVGGKFFAGQGYAWCRNDGGGATWSCFDVGANHWLVDAVELADLDQDGDLDAVAAAQETVGGAWVVLWYERIGSNPTLPANWVRHDIAFDGPFGKLEVVDLDRDGDLDVVGGADWWRNDGGTPIVWAAQTVPLVFSPPIGATDSWALADVDRDGDLDMAAESSTNGILWMANNLPSAWIGSQFFDPAGGKGPSGDFALADLDRDGDPDLLAGMLDNVPPAAPVPRLSWFENDVATGGAFDWTEHALEPEGTTADHLQAHDFDRDGDPDVAMAAGNDAQSWLNGGGQFALEALPVQPAQVVEGREAAVLALDAFHRGRDGEAAMELQAVSLLFEQTEGDPLSQLELDGLVEAVRLYRDDGSGAFGPEDQQVASAPTVTISAGHGVLALADGVGDLQHVPADTPATYFVTVDLEATASALGLPMRVTHTPGVGCTLCDPSFPPQPSAAENASFDVPLLQEMSPPATATFAILPDTFGSGFSDGFETGNTTTWDGTTP